MEEQFRGPIKKRLAEAMKTAAEHADKIKGLDSKILKARDDERFADLPELKERRSHAAGKHAASTAEVAALEAQMVRARELDRTLALRQAAKAACERAVEAGDAAREAVALAVQKTSDAMAGAEVAARYIRALGGNPAGWYVPPAAIASPRDPTLFPTAGVVRVHDVRWPVVAPSADVPKVLEELLPPWAVGPLVAPEEMARHREIAAELDGVVAPQEALARGGVK